MALVTFFATATDSRVDAENGILKGVSIISVGDADGHTYLGEPIRIDSMTIDQVVTAGNGFADGVPVKFDHGTGIADLVGAIKGIYRDGDTARGDLYLLQTHECYATILEMAEKMPSNFGLSISFLNSPEPILGNDNDLDQEDDDEERDEESRGNNAPGTDIVAYAARVQELYSADLVQNPACNESLFQTIMPENTPETPQEEVIETPSEPVTSPEEPTPVVEESPKIDNPLILAEELSVLRNIHTEFTKNVTELASVRSELSALKKEVELKDKELTELQALHASVKSVLGLSASVDVPEINSSEEPKSILEQYESLTGEARLKFFSANRDSLFKAMNGK
jgi:hypothetical protein